MAHPALMPVNNPADIAFERGEGAYLFDQTGRRFVDFAAGIAVNALGHCHPHLVAALNEQASKVWHTSIGFRIPGREKLAERIVALSFADQVFFTNSGLEAIECALKAARRYQVTKFGAHRNRFITFRQSFHGRSIATIAAAGNEKYTKDFGLLPDWFDHLDPEDLGAVEAAITNETCGILIEPVQGEGGIRPMSDSFLKGLRHLCDKHNLTLIFDEIQCGYGRTGKMWAHEWAGVEPDIMALAKGIGSGFPLGACVVRKEIGDAMGIGSHGSTYGSNPLAMAVGNAVLDVMEKPEFLGHVNKITDYLMSRLAGLQQRFATEIVMVRGKGLMVGIKFAEHMPVNDMIGAARANGLLTVAAGDNVMRLLPPLIITEAHVDEAIDILEKTISEKVG